jgi:alkanesulfonate monooxygenase SsuD/methylene tetrahydromethanopterin reductase-like flavin-dependent oxidoreductase (luciferase family)
MMHAVQFGFCVPIFASPGKRLFRTPNFGDLDTNAVMQVSQKADQLGYDSLWIADHMMLGKDDAILEGWTVTAALAGSTKNARLGLIHQSHFLRHPAFAAKMTATLDQICNGRFIYFIDGANAAHEYKAYGMEWYDEQEERIIRMLDGLELTKQMWTSSDPVTYEGEYYQAINAVSTPHPVQKPHPPIWFGEAHPMTLEATAKQGDGWNTVPVPRTELKRRLAALEDECNKIGRSYDDIEKSYETQILIAEDMPQLQQKVKQLLDIAPDDDEADADLIAFANGTTDIIPNSLSETFLVGTVDMVKEQVQGYIDLGLTHFLLWFMDAPDESGMTLFIAQVAPEFR